MHNYDNLLCLLLQVILWISVERSVSELNSDHSSISYYPLLSEMSENIHFAVSHF